MALYDVDGPTWTVAVPHRAVKIDEIRTRPGIESF
jgi:hypothetical protein